MSKTATATACASGTASSDAPWRGRGRPCLRREVHSRSSRAASPARASKKRSGHVQGSRVARWSFALRRRRRRERPDRRRTRRSSTPMCTRSSSRTSTSGCFAPWRAAREEEPDALPSAPASSWASAPPASSSAIRTARSQIFDIAPGTVVWVGWRRPLLGAPGRRGERRGGRGEVGQGGESGQGEVARAAATRRSATPWRPPSPTPRPPAGRRRRRASPPPRSAWPASRRGWSPGPGGPAGRCPRSPGAARCRRPRSAP